MRNVMLLIVIGAGVLLAWCAQAISAEYYVVESRSGIIFITDHEPQGGATLLKGPFDSPDAAEAALTNEEKEKLGTPGKGPGQGTGQRQGRGQGRGRNR